MTSPVATDNDNFTLPTARNDFAARVVRSMFTRSGAVAGAAWIGVLALIAVFAPFLANTHPLLLSEHGDVSSPLFHHLSSADVSLLGVFFLLIATLLWRSSIKKRLGFFVVGSVIVIVLSTFLIQPPELTVYEQYREKEATGAYDWVLRTPIPYSAQDYLRDRREAGLQAPLSNSLHTHWLGTEENGADVLSRIIHASRIALSIGFVATGIAMIIGVALGGLMGYFSGRIDLLGMRLVEIFESVPTLFLLLTFVAFFGRSLYMMMVIIGLTGWTGYARFARAEFLRLRQQDFVQAAIACGLPLKSILFRHILPNAMAPLIVSASFGVASAILAESSLSFLGLGLVDAPSWGQMLNQSVKSSVFNWWMAVFPGGAIFFTMFAYNMLGEALRDALDPYLQNSNS